MYVDLQAGECKLSINLALRLLRIEERGITMRTLRLCIMTAGLISSGLAASAQAPHDQKAEPPTITGNIEHGQYLATHVAMCVECHSPRDEQGRILPGQEFMGARLPINPLPDWATRAPRNRGLLGYTDAQAMRLLTEGAIGRHNEQLLLPMPRFRMSKEDASDVIVFLRSLH